MSRKEENALASARRHRSRTLAFFYTAAESGRAVAWPAELDQRPKGGLFDPDAMALVAGGGGRYARAETAMQAALRPRPRTPGSSSMPAGIACDCGRAEAAQAYFSAAEKGAATMTPASEPSSSSAAAAPRPAAEPKPFPSPAPWRPTQ